jgi:dCMP deaminase
VRGQIGAVVVDPRNRVVAVGYNGPPAGYPSSEQCDVFCDRAKYHPTTATLISYTDCPSIHAEQNALLVCDRTDRVNGTIYTTSDICWACAKMIANSGLSRVVVQVTHSDYRDPERSYELLRSCGLEVKLVSQ